MAHIGYIRVSAIDQNVSRQEKSFENLPFDLTKVYVDKFSGKTFKRPEFEKMNNFIRSGDTLVVKSIDRLARSQSDLVKYINELYERRIGFYCLDMSIFNFNPSEQLDPLSKFMLDVVSSLAELERSMIRQRQREGIEAAKLSGKHLGRPKKTNQLYYKADELVQLGVPKTVACKKLKIGLASYYRYLDYKKKLELEKVLT